LAEELLTCLRRPALSPRYNWRGRRLWRVPGGTGRRTRALTIVSPVIQYAKEALMSKQMEAQRDFLGLAAMLSVIGNVSQAEDKKRLQAQFNHLAQRYSA